MSSSRRSMRDGSLGHGNKRRDGSDGRPACACGVGWSKSAWRRSASAPPLCPSQRESPEEAFAIARCGDGYTGVRDRLRRRLLARLRRRRRSSASRARRPTSRSPSTRRSPAFMGHADRGKKFKMALGMLDHTAGHREGCGAELIVFHPGFLLGREREDAIARRRRAARRAPRAARGEGPARPVRRRGDGPRPRPRHGRRRRRDRRRGRLRAPRARLRAHARDERRRVPRRRPFAEALAPADAVLEPGAPFHIHFSDIQYANRNETKHLPYGEGTLRAEPLRDALARFDRPATVISESPDAAVDDALIWRRAPRARIASRRCSTRRSSRRTTSAGSIRRELDEAGAYAIGRAYVEQFEPRRIAVGRDMRLSSPAMAAARDRAARPTAGATSLDIGLVGTEMVYFAVGSLGLDGGIMVTASHNPKEYTGMKIVRRGALPVGGESGLLDVRDRARRAARRRDAGDRGDGARATTSGPRTSTAVLSFVDVGRDPAAARRDRRRERDGRRDAAARARAAARSTRCAATSSPTGRSRTTSRTRSCPRTASSSSRKTLEEGADLGVAFDGDADRCFFVDDTGEFVPGDFVTALFAEIDAREGAGREGHLRRPRELGRARDDRARRRRAAHQPRRPRVHQGSGCGRRTPSSPARCPATTTSATSSQADSGVIPFLLMLELDLEARPEAVGDPRAVPRALLHHRRDQHARRRRRAEARRS